ncbi:MAG TPA: TolC family protein [Candidatus Binataceae bacterium]|nr:TolC family protein [Candidatus Binataceae bacterium]
MARLLIAAAAMLLFIVPSAHAQQLTLRDAIDRALRFAPSLEASLAASDLSEATIREMRAPLYPSITASGEYNQAPGYDIVVTNRGLTRAQLELDYTAVDFGRRMSRVRAARYAAEAARLGLSATRAQIIFDTTVAYFDLMRAKHAVIETQANVERLARYVDTIDRLTRSGRAIENDSLKARTVRDSAELALSDARNDQMNAAIVLGSMIGNFTRYDFDIAEPGEIPPMPEGQLLHSPAMLAAMRQIESAKMEVQAAQAERYPTAQIALTAGALGVDPYSTFEQHAGASYDGLITMPIFQGGLITAHIDQAKAKLMQAQAQARSIEYSLQRQLEDARLHYQRALDSLAILARAQPNADDAFALTWTRFLGGGTATLLEVLDAYEQAENLRITHIQQDFAARLAAAQAAQLFGPTQ